MSISIRGAVHLSVQLDVCNTTFTSNLDAIAFIGSASTWFCIHMVNTYLRHFVRFVSCCSLSLKGLTEGCPCSCVISALPTIIRCGSMAALPKLRNHSRNCALRHIHCVFRATHKQSTVWISTYTEQRWRTRWLKYHLNVVYLHLSIAGQSTNVRASTTVENSHHHVTVYTGEFVLSSDQSHRVPDRRPLSSTDLYVNARLSFEWQCNLHASSKRRDLVCWSPPRSPSSYITSREQAAPKHKLDHCS